MKNRKRKSKKKALPTEIGRVADAATDYIKNWTNKQISRIQVQEKNPICIPTDNGYRIGMYKLQIYKNHTCDLLDPNGQFINRFDNKISAILYSIYTIKRRYHTAEEILTWDREINKRYNDAVFLRRAIERGRKRKDHFLVDISMARLEVAETKLAHARDKLLKMCRTAKYNKVWE